MISQHIKSEINNLNTNVDYFYSQTKRPFLLEKNASSKYSQFGKTGHWTQKEKIKYTIFVEFHHQKLLKKESRKLWKIFKMMSNFIKTRSSNQCRSHHQKLQANFGSLQNIILYFKKGISCFSSKAQNYLSQLDRIQYQVPSKSTPIYQSRILLSQLNHTKTSIQFPPNLSINNIQQKIKIQAKQKQQVGKIINLPPTNISYDQQSLLKPSYPIITKKLNNFIIQSNKSIFHQNSMQNIYLNPNILQINKFSPSEGIITTPNQNQHKKDKQWAECHHKFTLWITKLHTLINMNPGNIVYEGNIF